MVAVPIMVIVLSQGRILRVCGCAAGVIVISVEREHVCSAKLPHI